jgi:hypothetical protein
MLATSRLLVRPTRSRGARSRDLVSTETGPHRRRVDGTAVPDDGLPPGPCPGLSVLDGAVRVTDARPVLNYDGASATLHVGVFRCG